MTGLIALIPARSGSKGVPNKNIRNLSGHCLLEWSINACKESNLIEEVYVSTDSKEYQTLARKFGAKAPFLRPREISTDSSTDYDFLVHALDWLSHNDNEPEFIVHIRPSTPIRDPMVIDQAIKLFTKNSSNATALRSVHLMAESAYKTFEISEGGHLKSLGATNTELDAGNKPRQRYPKTYVANGYVDIISTHFVRKANAIHGNKVIPFITPVTHEIDTEEDFEFLEFLTRKESNFKNLFN